MNNDLISRSELKKAVNGFFDNHFKGLVSNELITYAKAVDNAIDNAPTVELTEEQAIDKLHETGWLIRHDKEMTERPQGKWNYFAEEMGGISITGECPNCKQRRILDNFCSNCGADMRGKEE